MAVDLAKEPVSTEQRSSKRPRKNPARRKAEKARNGGNATNKPDPTERPTVEQGTSRTTPAVTVRGPQRPATGSNPKTTRPIPNVRTLRPVGTRHGKAIKTVAQSQSAIVTGGLVGCAASAAILLATHLWYDVGGASSAILAAKSAKLCADNLVEELITSLKAGTYSSEEALDMLRRTSLAHASPVPGGVALVERIFREIDLVRKQRGREVDGVLSETYAELAAAGTRGASSAELHGIVIQQLMKLSTFASNSVQDVISRNPNLRPWRDGAVKSLQGPPKSKVPALKLNMTVRHKQSLRG